MTVETQTETPIEMGTSRKATTVHLAMKAHRDLEASSWEEYDDGFQGPPLQIKRVVIGDFLTLDPCHRDHDYDLPYLWRCKRFWASLKHQLAKRGHTLNWNEDGQPFISETRTVGRNGQPLRHVQDGRYVYEVREVTTA